MDSINVMINKQYQIIQALLYAPSLLVPYINYRGSEDIQFIGASIPDAPFIPYNQPDFCCILDGIETNSTVCDNITVKPLGPKGKVGIPYIIDDKIVKLTPLDTLSSTYLTEPPSSIYNLDPKDVASCLTNTKLENIHYIASDEFTNETLIAYALNYIAKQKSLPFLFVRHYQGAICSSSLSNKYMD